MMMQQVKKTINFDLLNPQAIIQFWEPEFNLMRWLTNKKRVLVTNKDQL